MRLQKNDIGKDFHGFKLIEIDDLPEYGGIGLLYRHEVTAMEVYHVLNKDKELFFSYIFETIPNDNTGVAHIVEHSVLAGSEKYPIRDPFMQLNKASANTYLNAITYPTKTLYPAASPLEKDFENIFSVYTDAVFSPLLREETFMQEGIRLEDLGDGEYVYKGVVFNEMLGDISDGEYVANNFCTRSLYPDTAYNHFSGGDPISITDLNYKKFKSFYMRYYHPSNAKLFMYGEVDIEKYLKLLNNDYLFDYSKINISIESLIPQKWKEPRKLQINCPSSDSDSGSIVATSFVTTDSSLPIEVLTLTFINELLMSSTGSPLYKAMLDSNLGDDVSNLSGLSSEYQLMPYTVAFSGVKQENVDKIEPFILKELSLIADKGFDKDLVDATMKRIDFLVHENSSSSPKGMTLLKRAMRGWLRGQSPKSTIENSLVIEELKAKIEENSRYLEEWMIENFINNSHRLLFIAEPDSEYIEKYKEKLSIKLKKKTNSFEEKEKERIRNLTKRFYEFQESGDSEENINKIPKISIKDLPKDVRTYNHIKNDIDNVPIWIMKEKTNSIAYYDFFIHLEDLNERELFLLQLYTKVLETCPVKDMDNTEVMKKVMYYTGGFNISAEVGSKLDSKSCIGIMIRVKMLEIDASNAIELTKDILKESKVNDYKTIWNSIVDLKNLYKSYIPIAGYRFASIAATGELSKSSKNIENMLGITQWLFLNEFKEKDVASIAIELEELKKKVNQKNRFEIHLTCEEKNIEQNNEILTNFLSSFKASEKVLFEDSCIENNKESVNSKKAFLLPSSINHTSYVLPAKKYGTKEQAAQKILSSILAGNDLWDEIRVNGGAYGVESYVDSVEAYFIFISARDPNLSLTYSIFNKVLEKYSKLKIDKEVIEAAIITNVSTDLKPHEPNRTSLIDFRRLLYKIDNNILKKTREYILSVQNDDLNKAAQLLLEEENSSIAFFCDKNTFETEKEKFNIRENNSTVLPV